MREKRKDRIINAVFCIAIIAVVFCIGFVAVSSTRTITKTPTVRVGREDGINKGNVKVITKEKKIIHEKPEEKPEIRLEEQKELFEEQYYDYLPDAAKDFIADVYRETETVVLTERNKKNFVPYLNPEYIAYLELSLEERQNVAVVPNTYLIDYVRLDGSRGHVATGLSEDGAGAEVLPSSYDLRDVDGVSYITDLKDQDELGICWAFASVEQIESYLLLHDAEYAKNPTLFSTRQMDYATANNAILNISNINTPETFSYDANHNLVSELRQLGDGGNFTYSSYLMSNGLSLVDESKAPWDEIYWTEDDMDPLYPYQVLNYEKSLYETKASFETPKFEISEHDPSDPDDKALIDDYLSTIKSNIIANGGAYVGTESPSDSCSAENLLDDSYIIRVDDNCVADSGHAMQIIGWDDDYEYSYNYCKAREYANTNVHNYGYGACKGGALGTVTGKGAWLLRNSWGDYTTRDYVWLAYDSLDSNIGFTTEISSMANRNWDNNYHLTFNNYIAGGAFYEVGSFDDHAEKVQAIKFTSDSIDTTYEVRVYVGTTEANAVMIYYTTIKTDYPGVYTVDLSDKNIQVSDLNLYVSVMDETCNNDDAGACMGYMYRDSISVFTKNLYDEPLIKVADDTIVIPSDQLTGSYDFEIHADTRNIKSGEPIYVSMFRVDANQAGTTYPDDNHVSVNNLDTNVHVNNIYEGVWKLGLEYEGEPLKTINVAFGDTTIQYQARIDGYLEYDDENIGFNITEEKLNPFTGTPTKVVPEIKNENYEFVNWTKATDYYGESGPEVSTEFEFTPTKTDDYYYANAVYYANFKAVNKTVTIYLNDSETTTEVYKYTVPYGTYVSAYNGYSPTLALDNYSRDITERYYPTIDQTSEKYQYRFSSWTNGCGSIVLEDCSITANYAANPHLYEMSLKLFDEAGNIVNSNNITTYYGETITVAEHSLLVGDDEYSGPSYTLIGGFYEAAGEPYNNIYTLSLIDSTCGNTITGDCQMNIQIQWEKTINLTIHSNDEFDETITVSVPYGSTINYTLLEELAFTNKTRRYLQGASLDSNAVNTPGNMTEDTEIYLKWSSYLLDYLVELNDILPSQIGKTYTDYVKVDSNLTEVVNDRINNFTEEEKSTLGYTLAGIYTDPEYTNEWHLDTDLMPAHSLDLYFKWERVDVPITFTVLPDASYGTWTSPFTTAKYGLDFVISNNKVLYSTESATLNLPQSIFYDYQIASITSSCENNTIGLSGCEFIATIDRVARENVPPMEDFVFPDNGYTYNEDGRIVSGITANTTVADYIASLGLEGEIKIYQGEDELAADALIGTGSTIRIYDGTGALYGELYNAVSGDISGDGIINSADLLAARRYLLGNELSDVEKAAAEVTGDDVVNSADLLKMRRYLLGMESKI